MNKANNYQKDDAALNAILQEWKAPDVPLALEQRMLSAYRQQINHVPFWQRIFTASIRVPMPIIAVQAILLLVAGAAVLASFDNSTRELEPIASIAPRTEIIEVPVVQEKVVVRYVQAANNQVVLRTGKARNAPTVLPAGNKISTSLNSLNDSGAWQFWPELTAQKLPTEWAAPPAKFEKLSNHPAALDFKMNRPDALKAELPLLRNNEFILLHDEDPDRLFNFQFKRTFSRAGGWITKPFEKGVNLYRQLPETFSGINSFIAPAKDACFSPFRTKPENVNIN